MRTTEKNTWTNIKQRCHNPYKFENFMLGRFKTEKDSAWEYLNEYHQLHDKLPPEYPIDYDIIDGSLIPCR